MERAFFKYEDTWLGTLVYDNENHKSFFYYNLCSNDVSKIHSVRPSIIIEILETVRRDAKNPSFDFYSYINKYDAYGFHFEKED